LFNSITGTITGKGPGYITIDTFGLEWYCAVTTHTLEHAPPVGSEGTLFVYLHHREELMQLFGFSSSSERSVFMDLLKVSGIGPRQAQKILSGIQVEDFITSLDAGNVDRLAALPGLGKKTAQKIVLTLKGKLSIQEEEKSDYAEIVEGLVEMGFNKKKAIEAVKKAAEELHSPSGGAEGEDKESVEKELFKQAIIFLSQ
jgi:Holliday junction DNA helicase RuvA